MYASPAYGYAQIALAVACAATGRRATVFVAKRRQHHPRTAEASRQGATIIEIPNGYLTNVQSKARAYTATQAATLLPFGLDDPRFITELTAAITALNIPAPGMAWVAAGSGTLSRVLGTVWPATPIAAVAVGHEPKVGRARLYRAPEPFERDAKHPPPFPSCSNYDAKVWQHITTAAVDGRQHLFWNVAA